MTDRPAAPHSSGMHQLVPRLAQATPAGAGPTTGELPREPDSALRPLAITIEELYRANFQVIWRGLRRLGVAERSLDDALQDVFLVAHRKLGTFEARSSHRAWLFGIALRVAREYRRRDARLQLDETAVGAAAARPHSEIEARREIEQLDKILGTLQDDQRAVFVMTEIEGFSAPEIAEALAVNLNTVYSRLRLARRAFERALARQRRAQERAEP